MKRFYASFLLAAACVLSAEATIITVSNNALSPAQYNDLQAAHDAANDGDTIYLHGSSTTYGNLILTKQLTVIGAGHHPRKQSPLTSKLGGVNISVAAASGSTIDGLVILQSIEATAVNLNDITIRRCEILGSMSLGYTWGGFYPMSNWLIENNIVLGNNSPWSLHFNNNADMNNWIVRNNILYNMVRNVNSPITFDHNLFYPGTSATGFFEVYLSTFTNNIFYMTNPGGAATSTFLNNITFNTGNDVLPYGSNTGSGNIVGQDPQFVSFPPAGAVFSITHNYNLQPSSPGANAATDGTDIGPEGGLVGFSMTGEPWIPQIRMFNIQNTTVPVGGQLNISVTATKAEDQ